MRDCTYLLPIRSRAHSAIEIDRDRAEFGKIVFEISKRPHPLE